jgi:hypothetical protein
MLVAGVVTAAVVGRGEGAPAGDRAAVPEPAVTTATPPTAPAPGSTSPSPVVTADAEAVALATLYELRLRDLPTVALRGQYVAQLASKVVGIVDPHQTTANGSHTFEAVDILAEHLRLRHADNGGVPVVLMLSTVNGRRQRYGGQPLWVTFCPRRLP